MELTPRDEQRYAKLLPWLSHPFAITDRLRDRTGEAVLQPLNQGWIAPDAWDSQHISLDKPSIWRREIIMLAHQQVCWYARSLFPEMTYRNHPAFFAALKEVSLGDLIFTTPGITQDSLVHYAIHQDSLEYQWLPEVAKPKPAQVLWLRFATYRMASLDPFYLLEIFLPAVEQYCE